MAKAKAMAAACTDVVWPDLKCHVCLSSPYLLLLKYFCSTLSSSYSSFFTPLVGIPTMIGDNGFFFLIYILGFKEGWGRVFREFWRWVALTRVLILWNGELDFMVLE